MSPYFEQMEVLTQEKGQSPSEFVLAVQHRCFVSLMFAAALSLLY